MDFPAQSQLLPCRPDVAVDLRQLLVQFSLFCHKPIRGDTTLLQNRSSLHVPEKFRFHAGQPFLVERLGLGQCRCVCQGGVQLLPFLLFHIEDGALLGQAGQRFLCADLKCGYILLRGNTVFPEKCKLLPIMLGVHDVLFHLRCHPGRILPLFDFA